MSHESFLNDRAPSILSGGLQISLCSVILSKFLVKFPYIKENCAERSFLNDGAPSILA